MQYSTGLLAKQEEAYTVSENLYKKRKRMGLVKICLHVIPIATSITSM